jgi:hypothetical protein
VKHLTIGITVAKLVPDTQDEAPQPTTPSYKLVGESKLPVSKEYGPLWKSRRDAAAKKRSERKFDSAWEESIRYYNNDQTSNRYTGQTADSAVRGLSSKIVLEYAEIENVIFANTNSASAAIYAKNPTIAVSTENPDLQKMGMLSQELVNTLFAKLEAPGVDLKPKAQRAAVTAFLCNLAWLKVGWVAKQDSTEQAMGDLTALADRLAKPDLKQSEIEEIEGSLRALDDQFSMLSESGPFAKFLPPGAILRDPQSIEENLSDAYWAMEEEYLPTSYIKAKWTKKGEDGQDVSVYEPTHFLPAGSGAGDYKAITDQINNFSIFDSEKSYTDLGFESQSAYNAAKITKVWWVWDKATRRVFLYNDKSWTWPIWVWDDPYKLTTFYPWVPMYYYLSPQGGESKGEVSYYLDQQDSINLCNSLLHTVRVWVATKLGYDPSAIDNATLNRYLFSNKLEAIPLTVPDGKKLEDVLPKGLTHPAASQLHLFDKAPIYASIDKISVVNEVLRGGQFKTNTTNQAIGYYQNVTQSRYDAIIDKVEDAIGRFGYLLLQLCWRFMEADQVAMLLGDEDAAEWTNLSDKQIRQMSIRVEGGSTQKPTSSNKKQEALGLMQILGQFASASPVAVVLAVKAASRAFSDSIDIDDDEWEQLVDSMMQKAMMAPVSGPDGSVPQAPGAAPPTDGGDPGAQPSPIDSLPPEAKQALMAMIQQGVAPPVALQKVLQALGQGNAPSTPTAQ